MDRSEPVKVFVSYSHNPDDTADRRDHLRTLHRAHALALADYLVSTSRNRLQNRSVPRRRSARQLASMDGAPNRRLRLRAHGVHALLLSLRHYPGGAKMGAPRKGSEVASRVASFTAISQNTRPLANSFQYFSDLANRNIFQASLLNRRRIRFFFLWI